MRIKKRGQISYFIAIGIIILLSVGAVLYYKFTETADVVDLTDPTEDVPIEVAPLKQFTDSCVDTVTKDALTRLGERGGYINPEKFGLAAVPDDPTRGNALQTSENGNSVAYWWHLDSSNRCNGNCAFDTERPPLNAAGERSIETQVKRHIEEQLPLCLKDFVDFKEQGFIIIKQPMSVETQIARSDFRVLVTLPLEIKKDGVTYKLNSFYSQQDVNLRKLYELASVLTAAQYTYKYMERQTVNVIAAFGGIDKNKLPPVAETSFKPQSPTYWTRTAVAKHVQDLLTSYTQLFQVPGTANYVDREQLPERSFGVYKLYDLPVNSLQGYSYKDVAVQFNYYNWWDTYFDISGRGVSGEVIGPEQGFAELLSFMGFQRYNNYYDVSYPVLVELYDTEAYGGAGYSFVFGLEVNVRNNEEMDNKFQEIDTVLVGEDTLFCNANQRNSGEYNVAIVDALTGKGVDDVLVSYSCGTESCVIGHTNKGLLSSQFPLCAGGIVTYHKEGYESQSERITTLLDEGDDLRVELEPYRELSVNVQKKRFRKATEGWVFEDSAFDLLDNEIAIVMLRRVDSEYETATVVRGGEDQTLQLLPGTYEVDISLVFELPAFGVTEVVIPKQTQTAGPFWDQQTIEIPEIVFDENFPEGGASLNENTGYLVIDHDDLRGDSVTFYSLATIASNSFNSLTHDDLNRLDLVEEYSKTHRGALEPVFG